MYYPYFRGKQYELITIRESLDIFRESNFVPIIEPVKESLGSLRKTLTAIRQQSANAILVVNPFHGYHSSDGESIEALLLDYADYEAISIGILIKEDTAIEQIITLCNLYKERRLSLIHAGFPDGKGLAGLLGERVNKMQNIFVDGRSSKLYQKHFINSPRILIRDGFERRRGKDHPDNEFFSDLHATYKLEGMDGFGDFLMVGDGYSESGGPAYAVVIHLTYIDKDRDDEMHIHHFKSIRQDTPTDPAGKFAEALDKLIFELNSPSNKILETRSIGEFRKLHRSRHFPGLGYVKKLSMNHHIETLANYFNLPTV